MAPTQLSPALIEVLSNTPAIQPPPGVTPNFVNPPSKGPVLMILNVIFLPLMLAAVTMRMLVKGVFVRSLGWDDYTCAVAAACSVVHSACIFSSLDYGFGKHLYDIRAITLIDESHIRHLTSSIIPYPFTIFAVKLSILLLYRRVFSIDRFLHYGTILGFVLLMIVQLPYIVTQIYTVVHCASPRSLLVSPFCSHLYTVNITQSAVNIVTDFYVLCLPLPRLVKLNLPIRRKIGLCFIFAAGFAASIVSIVRLVLMIKTLSLTDYTWGTATTIELSGVEVNVAIICACMTTLPPFLARSKTLLNSLRTKYGTRSGSVSWSRKASKQSDGWSSLAKTNATEEIPMQVPARAYVRLDEERVRTQDNAAADAANRVRMYQDWDPDDRGGAGDGGGENREHIHHGY